MEQQVKSSWTLVQKTCAGLVVVFMVGLGLTMCDTNEAHAAPAAPAPVEEPGFLDRLRAKLPDNPFAMSAEDKLEIVKEYNAGTAAAGQAARAAAAKAQRDAAVAAENKAKYDRMVRALRQCMATATNQ